MKRKIKQPPPVISEELLAFGGKDAGVLERFMKEFFPFGECKKIGLFTPEMKGDYYAQAKKVCVFFGFKSVYEYGSKEVRCHISYCGERPKDEQEFVSVFPSIYE